MTVHLAKGLEFDAAFITDLKDGLFPHGNWQKEDAGLEEERYLMCMSPSRVPTSAWIQHAFAIL